MSRLPARLVGRVLDRLAPDGAPEPSLAGLADLYAAWCRSVPLDNVRKLVHLAAGDPGPLPGDDPADFFEAWLAHGAGGTCWAGNGALHALLESLGFRARRAVATMLVAPDLPPNHGSVVVDVDGAAYVVDASMLHGEPLRLAAAGETAVDHPAWGVRAAQRDGAWHLRWRPVHAENGIDCRIDELGVGADRFRALHEATCGWSPFNFSLYARLNRGDRVVGAAFGQRVEIGADGRFARRALDPDERLRLLVEDLGVDEALARRLPPDAALTPPPGSRTATSAGS